MKKRPELPSEPRTIIGHQVKKIRNEGNIPATVYGHNYKSQSLSVNSDAFMVIYKEVGETGLVNLAIKGSSVPVLVHTVQKHPVNQTILHVEFFKVNLTEKIKTHVPVVITGSSPAIEQHLGTLLTVLQEVEVEALPDELPESIPVDVSSLIEVNSEIKIEEITVPGGVSLLTEKGAVVVKIGALVVEKEPEPTTIEDGEGVTQETTEESSEEKQETPSQE